MENDTVESIIERTAEALNFPGSEKLRRAVVDELQSQNRRVVAKEVRSKVEAFVKSQGAKQVLSLKTPWRHGHVVAQRRNQRWDCDLIDNTATPSGEYNFILVCQDVHTRFLFAEALKNKSQQALAETFNVLFDEHGAPRELHGDQEFTSGALQRVYEEQGVEFVRQEAGDYNHTATLASAIQHLQAALSRRMLASNSDWAPLLQNVVRGQNLLKRPSTLNKSSSAAYGGEDAVLEFQLRERDAHDMQENTRLRGERDARLVEEGGFRVPTGPTQRGFRRVYKPRFSEERHEVEDFEAGFVRDEQGQEYSTRRVLPVPESTEARVAPQLKKGSAVVENTRATRLQAFGGDLKAWLKSKRGSALLPEMVEYARETLKMPLPLKKPKPREISESLGFRVQQKANGRYEVLVPNDPA